MRIAKIFLQEILPCPRAIAVGSSAVGQNHELVGIRVVLSPFGVEPVRDTIHSERWGVAGISDKDGTAIGLQIVDSIGHRPALGLRPEVMIVDPCWGLAPDGPGVGESPDQFFLLGVHTNTPMPFARQSSIRAKIFKNCSSRSGGAVRLRHFQFTRGE